MMLVADILFFLLDIYLWIIIAYVIMSWLIAFGVVNTSNPNARKITEVLARLTDPVMKPIQKAVPPIAGIDLSPIIVIIGIQILKKIIAYVAFSL